MNVEELREYCLALPHATEDIKWGNDLCFCIGDKMFATTSLNPNHGFNCSFKCAPDTYARMIEREGVTSAPYTGRFGWICIKKKTALTSSELKELITDSYNSVKEGLPAHLQKSLK